MKTDQQQLSEVESARLQFKLEPDKALFSCEHKENSRGQSVIQQMVLGLGSLVLEKYKHRRPKTEDRFKEMKCEDLQLNLSTYLDDILTAEERSIVDEHLARCPLCRQKLADFQVLRNSLRSLPRPALSKDLLAAMRNGIAQEVKTSGRKPWFATTDDFVEWLQMRVMPYSVGTAASLIFGLLLLWSLLSAASIPNENTALAKLESPTKSTVLPANSSWRSGVVSENAFDLNAADYAAARLTVSGGSPSLNPQGALVALTKSIVRGNMKDDELVIVADVFGDGLAQIAEVVEPSSDVQAVSELEKALKNDPNYAPFVPASFDGRSETVRVIFKINRVDIKTNTKSKSRYK